MSADQGRVDERPVPRLLLGLRSRELTGLVQIRENSGRSSSLYVRQGLLVHVERPDTLDRLDQVLVETGMLGGEEMARAQGLRERTGLLLGQVLRQMGLVDEQQLAEALRWQLRRKVTRLFSSGDGTYAISQVDHPFGAGASSPGMSVEPRALVFPGILASYDPGRLSTELAVLSGHLVRLGAVNAAQLTEAGFDARHGQLLTHLHRNGHHIDPRWLESESGDRGREVKAVLLALFYLGLLELPGQPDASATQAAPTVAVAAEISRPRLDLGQLFILAERHFRNGDLVHAEATFEEANRNDPRNERVRAYLIWIHFWKQSEARRQTVLDLTLSSLREVIRSDREFAYGYYFVGKLLKLRNELQKAEHAFRVAVQRDPDLIDAQRELRLMKMRRARG